MTKTSSTAGASEIDTCIVAASEFHQVNAAVLRAILKVESNLNPTALGRNKNGTWDIGIGQMNSAHLPELARRGITLEHLQDGCAGTFVAAWHLKKQMDAYGNTLEAIARYHSSTPYYNRRYQILLANELVKAGVIEGLVQPVPPLK